MIEEKYIENLNDSFDILKQFQPDQNFKSENRYFKTEKELSEFIKFCQINMVPVVVSWCSNIHGLGIRWRVYTIVNIKEKWEEANRRYHESSLNKLILHKEITEIQINTLEQLRLLYAVSEDIEKEYFMV